MKKFRFALFDVDGTLIDSMMAWKKAATDYMTQLGFGQYVTDSLLVAICQLSKTDAISYLAKKFGITEPVDTESVDLQKILLEYYREEVGLRPGVVESLSKMKKAGVRMGILSASYEAALRELLGRLGILSYFEFILTSETFPEGKHSSAIFEEGLRRLGATPEETVMFEDTLYPMQTAKKMGIDIVAIQDPAEPRQDAVRAIASLYMKDGFMDPDKLPF